jgi:hypothetical protein
MRCNARGFSLAGPDRPSQVLAQQPVRASAMWGELGARATTTTHALPPGRGAAVGARYVRARAADADGGHSHVRPICTY